MDSIRVSEAFDSGSIPDGTTDKIYKPLLNINRQRLFYFGAYIFTGDFGREYSNWYNNTLQVYTELCTINFKYSI